MDTLPLKQIVEGAILAAETPLSVDQLLRLFEDDRPEPSAVRSVLEEIEQDYEGRGFELRRVASGYRFQVRSDYGQWVSRLWKEKPARYSRALLETLALIAYRQPVTRGDIEAVRGVAVSTSIMRTLLEREWVRIVGHRDLPGHPALYATTGKFLDYFNLKSLDELPSLADIKSLAGDSEEPDLEDELLEPRRLTAEPEEFAAPDDVDLDAVSERVSAIRENIRSLFAPDEQADVPAAGEHKRRATVTPISKAIAAAEPPDAGDTDA